MDALMQGRTSFGLCACSAGILLSNQRPFRPLHPIISFNNLVVCADKRCGEVSGAQRGGEGDAMTWPYATWGNRNAKFFVEAPFKAAPALGARAISRDPVLPRGKGAA
jgi:hypothetical protein